MRLVYINIMVLFYRIKLVNGVINRMKGQVLRVVWEFCWIFGYRGE